MATTPQKPFQEPSDKDKAILIVQRRDRIVQEKTMRYAELAGKTKK